MNYIFYVLGFIIAVFAGTSVVFGTKAGMMAGIVLVVWGYHALERYEAMGEETVCSETL